MGGIIFKNAGDDATGETVANTVITGLIGALNLGLFRKKGEFMVKTLRGIEIDPSEKLKQIRTTNLVTNLTVIGASLNRYYLSNKKRIKPAAVLAGIPLGTVDELSMALSDRILKYRATGGIFLAHQDGGNESLRIVCKAWGIGRYLFLTMLDFLFMYGSAKIVDLFKGISLFGSMVGAPPGEITKDIFGKSVQKKNPWKRFNEMNKDEGREEYHSTFPIVTKNRVYSSMYLETYDIVESVNTGMNMLTVTLFLRKYRPSYPLEMTNVRPEKKGRNTSWYRQKKVKDQAIWTKLSLRWSDSIIDFGLSILVGIHKWNMMLESSGYNFDELMALTFATHLDKSRGMDNGEVIGIEREDPSGGIIKVNEEIEKGMGLMIYA